MFRIYSIYFLRPFINWTYFYYAWGVKAETPEAEELRADAERLLNHLSLNGVAVRGVFQLYPCYSDGDDVVLEMEEGEGRLCFLRQQHTKIDEPCLCLSDFIAPKGYEDASQIADHIGLFATTVDERMNSCPCCAPNIETKTSDDPYSKMLRQTVLDRLAEAGAEMLHVEVRKSAWGYAPDENLTPDDLHHERFQGIRPAVGYPSLPDQSFIFDIQRYLPFEAIGITLTENGMMQPHASTCGLMFAHPKARYFSIGEVTDEQLADYAARRNRKPEDLRKFLLKN